MKKTFFFASLIGSLIFTACSKSENDNSTGIKTIKYDFTTTNAGNFSIQAKVDTVEYSEVANTLTWTKTISVTGSDSAVLTVFPPTDWVSINNEADVNLKISVNGVEKVAETAHFIGLDRPNGLRIATGY